MTKETTKTMQEKLAGAIEAVKKAVLTGEFHTQYGVNDELRLEALRVIMAEIEPALTTLKDLEETLASEEMVEKVSNAIAEAESKKPYDSSCNPYGQFFGDTYRDVAKAAIATILGK